MPDHQADARDDAQTDVRALLAELTERIRREGPLSVEAYMEACLGHPRHGYYRKAQAIGAAGDFVTAPEISQVFGELIGLWCAVTWDGMGRPTPLRLIELGPGRGTLMADALRAAKALPGFLAAVSVHLVEISPPLRHLQRETLARGRAAGGPDGAWHEAVEEVPAGPAIVIANEFLDALPVRQLVRENGAWRERVVTLSPNGRLQLAAGPAAQLTGGAAELLADRPVAEGTIIEIRPGEARLLGALAARASPLTALFIDYGPAETAFGDTLQAVRGHAYADPLLEPGAADLTAHVQFAALVGKARAAGLAADGPLTQAEFLGRLGIAERTARLMAANPARAGRDRGRDAAADVARRHGPALQGPDGSLTGPSSTAGVRLRPRDLPFWQEKTVTMPQSLIVEALSALPGIAHGFFTRRGGVSEGIYASLNCGVGSKDNPEAVSENRARVAATVGARRLITCHQVHGTTAVIADNSAADNWRPKADALVTTTPGVALGVLTADCAPILFADPQAGVIGAAHAGWRGGVAGVAEFDHRGDGGAGGHAAAHGGRGRAVHWPQGVRGGT